jgi:hypothetical protein
MPEQPQSKPTRHLVDQWLKGTPLEQAREAVYAPRCTHQVFLGTLRIRCTLPAAGQHGSALVCENAIIDGVPTNPMEVTVWDQIIISNGAIVFPIDKVEVK